MNGAVSTNLLIWHWGREGAGAKFTYELASHLRAKIGPHLVISSAYGSDLYAGVQDMSDVVHAPVATFDGNKSTWRGKISAAIGLAGLPMIAYRFFRMVRANRIEVALCTFQSIWDVATLPVLAHGPVRSVLILHDAFFHPGDEYPLRHLLLRKEIESTDALIVLSDYVRHQAVTSFGYPSDRIWKMPHGAFEFSGNKVSPAVHPRGARRLRLIFFGRIVAYKGVDLLLGTFYVLRVLTLTSSSLDPAVSSPTRSFWKILIV
jgi:glycosyltransferase involved in cell wall biosynthesis